MYTHHAGGRVWFGFLSKRLLTTTVLLAFLLACFQHLQLGTLCIIDPKPRPNGLTEDEIETLKDLAIMVVKGMLMYGCVHDFLDCNFSYIFSSHGCTLAMVDRRERVSS